MKLLTQVLPREWRTVPAGGAFTVAVCAALLGLEVLGRRTTSDVHDGLAALALVAIMMLVAARHRREPLPWVRSGVGRARRLVEWLTLFRYEHGYDLRCRPPIPARTPPLVGWAVLGLASWAGAAAACWAVYPDGWRAAGVASSYVLYLAALLALWSFLLALWIAGVYLPMNLIDQRLKARLGASDRRAAEVAVVVGYAVLEVAVAWNVSPAPALALCGLVALGALLAYLPARPGTAAVIWRNHPGEPPRTVPFHRVFAVVIGLAALLVLAALTTACGGRLFSSPSAEGGMPVTVLLGAMAAWVVPGVVLTGAVWMGVTLRNDPSRTTPPTAVIAAGAPPGDRAEAARKLAAWGWVVRADGADPRAADVGLELVPADRSEATEFDPLWPLRVSVADLDNPAVKERLVRRDEIQVRRQFFRGLAKLFRKAAAFKGPGGGGFVFAPHWWFMDGLEREDGDGGPGGELPRLVGPPYSRVFSPRARQHMHKVLRAAQVDLIFVEDGVSHRKVEAVLRVLLELYDVHGGKRRAEEAHFRGQPKVRVMLHDYEPDNPFRSDLYPEPKFDELSRVRVLHIFRDRGGEEEEVEPPFDFSWSPAPANTLRG